MSAIKCNVKTLKQINDHVYYIELTPEAQYSFEAGQYLQVIMSEKDKRPFSIASSPDQEHIELHIGATKENSYAMQVVDLLKDKGYFHAEIGLGQAQLKTDSERPILLIAGGTGFSYVQSIARQLAKSKPNHHVTLYWGGKNNQSLYAAPQMEQWQQAHENFTFVPVVENPDESWQGKTGYVHKAAMEDIDNLQDHDIYVAGHFDMVKIVREDFVAKGADPQHMFADAFSYLKWD